MIHTQTQNTMKNLAQISTHKAVKENGEIRIYLKGMDVDTKCPKGLPLFSEEDIKNYPDWFKDEFLYTVEHEDDVFAIMERYEEDNRINAAEFQAEIS